MYKLVPTGFITCRDCYDALDTVWSSDQDKVALKWPLYLKVGRRHYLAQPSVNIQSYVHDATKNAKIRPLFWAPSWKQGPIALILVPFHGSCGGSSHWIHMGCFLMQDHVTSKPSQLMWSHSSCQYWWFEIAENWVSLNSVFFSRICRF